VTGASKAAALRQTLEGPRDPHRFPCQLIQPESGKLSWLLDTSAAEMGR
jgi:6-phosphogluconolactonase/glucosamine-6-phosphate isomerase/deaminase